MTVYGMPFFLEDKTGLLTGSDFDDLHERLRLSFRCTARDATHTAYMIFDTSSRTVQSHTKPLAVLDFGSKNSLGTISVGPNTGSHVKMKHYLTKCSTMGGSKHRKFTASDGQEYFWHYQLRSDQEWTCTNASGYLVAYYSLKLAGEPPYPESSGCTLTLDEGFPHLAVEILASLLIMRHIAAHNL